MQNKGTVVLAFALGVAIGANWPKIKKYVLPMTENLGKKSADAYHEILSFIVEQKERIEDLLAEAKIKKKIEKTRKRSTAPKRKRKRTTSRGRRKEVVASPNITIEAA